MKDYFRILGVTPPSSLDEIKNAYRKLAKKYHPDLNKSPNAASLFIEITEAYEVLTYQISNKQTEDHSAHQQQEYEDFIAHVREAAQRRARMKYEKFKKEHEAFQESGLYDVVLLFKYLGLVLLPFLAAALIIFPIVVAITSGEIAAFFYLFVFWVIGLFLFYYIFQQGKDYFKHEKFYYSFHKVWSKLMQTRADGTEHCFYAKGRVADSTAFTIEMYRVKNIKLENRGPLQHYAGIDRTLCEVSFPRSRKALLVHLFVSLTKCSALLLSISFLSVSSFIWRFIFGLCIAWLAGSLLLLFAGVKSKVGYLFSSATLLKIAFWLIPIVLISKISWHPFNIVTNDLDRMMIVILAFTDSFLEQALKIPKHTNLYRPFIKSYRILDTYFSQKYNLYLEVPLWTAIYPLLRWLL
ncbi:MAG TPA: DnaJ domain-containing protein [Bacteroidales bacterium]|nr:DnaJ domain-containing protein [Bacteroidales bacterium]